MIERICQTKEVVISTLALEYPIINNISTTEWSILNNLVDILQLYKDKTNEISGLKKYYCVKNFNFCACNTPALIKL